jgi:hypothetical protein
LKYLDEEMHRELEKEVDEIQKMIYSFIKKL